MNQDNKKINALIEAILEQEFFTKSGAEIEFKVYEKSPRKGDGLNRGWVVHLIEAYVNGEEAGYIKISYIPKENFEKEYPTIIHYVDKIHGNRLWPPKDRFEKKVPKGARYPHWSDHLNKMDLVTQVLSIAPMAYANMFHRREEWYSPEKVKELEGKTEPELKKIKNDLIKVLEKEHGEAFRGFAKFHVDKPIVDYISVEKDFRRKGIATALYLKAAKWLAGKGMKLHASGIQSKAAQKTWDRMKKDKNINIKSFKSGDRKRFYIEV